MYYKNLINLKQADNSSSLSSDSAVAGTGQGELTPAADVSRCSSLLAFAVLAFAAFFCGLAWRLQRGRRWQQASDAAVEQLLRES